MGGVCATTAAIDVVTPRCGGKTLRLRVLEAAAEGDMDKLKSLFELGAKVDACDATGRSALHLACAEGHLQVVEFLLGKGAKVAIKDKWGNEPIQEAIFGGHKEIVERLEREGAQLSDESKYEMEIKFFHFAAIGNVHGVADLVERGASINATDYLGKNALHIAAERGNAEVVRYLLNQGADKDSLDNQGDNAMNLAMEQEHFDVQTILREAGATPHMKVEVPPVSQKRARRASFTVMEAFPMPIAQAMLDGREIEPITKSCVSLFYSDIVGFTTISSTINSATVSQMLNSLFRKFDRLAYVHGVQKVDVIGDAYIAATNFTDDQKDDHAARLARFAMDALAAARETPIDEANPDAGCVEIRIGMHCGPVSGIVVGSNVIKYTLMGEAVHIASKMESSGLPGRVQCSQASADLIAQQANDIEVIRREGPGVAVPGRCVPVPTYWVSNVRERTGRFRSCPDLSDFARSSSGGSHSSFDLDMGDWFYRVPSGGGCGVDSFQFQRLSSGCNGPRAGGGGGNGNGSPALAPALLRVGKDGPAALCGAAPAAPVCGAGGVPDVCSAGRRNRRRNSMACNTGPSLICRL